MSYCAPEVMEGAEYNKAADIYSIGMIIWELWYGQFVSEEITSLHKGNIETAIRAGARPRLTKSQQPPDDWKALIGRCWSANAIDRPTAGECWEFFTKSK